MRITDLRARLTAKVIDGPGLGATALAATWLRKLRRVGVERLPRSREVLDQVGIYPLLDRYDEPTPTQIEYRFGEAQARPLPGIDFAVERQLEFLSRLDTGHELVALASAGDPGGFRFGNGSFESGDAEILYALIRHLAPRRVIEVGSGNSTRVMLAAIRANQAAGKPATRLTCIEPYLQPWLESTGVEVIRQRVEELGLDYFDNLGEGDILFIDSSHVVRPQGDVTFELLELLPRLRPGVYVHVHDIFTPYEYPRSWIEQLRRIWAEQYLLEAFLCHNSEFEVVAALCMLQRQHPAALRVAAPALTDDRLPGSFWMRRRG
jgi:predicted O-methyltransferase YrrM